MQIHAYYRLVARQGRHQICLKMSACRRLQERHARGEMVDGAALDWGALCEATNLSRKRAFRVLWGLGIISNARIDPVTYKTLDVPVFVDAESLRRC